MSCPWSSVAFDPWTQRYNMTIEQEKRTMYMDGGSYLLQISSGEVVVRDVT
jgi:hypothetical protein